MPGLTENLASYASIREEGDTGSGKVGITRYRKHRRKHIRSTYMNRGVGTVVYGDVRSILTCVSSIAREKKDCIKLLSGSSGGACLALKKCMYLEQLPGNFTSPLGTKYEQPETSVRSQKDENHRN
jgi:hypothetical protein